MIHRYWFISVTVEHETPYILQPTIQKEVDLGFITVGEKHISRSFIIDYLNKKYKKSYKSAYVKNFIEFKNKDDYDNFWNPDVL